MTEVWDGIRLVLAGGLAALSLLAVYRTPLGLLWMARIAATEGGHLLAGVAAVCLVGGASTPRGLAATVLALVAIVLYCTPLIRGLRLARSLPKALSEASGDTAAQASPLSLGRLGRMRVPKALGWRRSGSRGSCSRRAG